VTPIRLEHNISKTVYLSTVANYYLLLGGTVGFWLLVSVTSFRHGIEHSSIPSQKLCGT